MLPRIFSVFAITLLLLTLPASFDFANYLADITVSQKTPALVK